MMGARVLPLLLVSFTCIYGIQVSEEFGDAEFIQTTKMMTALDELQQLINKAEIAPVPEFPALIKEARALIPRLTAEEKTGSLRIFLIMKQRVEVSISKLEKVIEDTRTIIKARIAKKEIRQVELKEEIKVVTERYERNCAARLREKATIERIKAILVKLLGTAAKVIIERTEENLKNVTITKQEKNETESIHHKVVNGQVVKDEHNQTSSEANSSSNELSHNKTSTNKTHELAVAHGYVDKTGNTSASSSSSGSAHGSGKNTTTTTTHTNSNTTTHETGSVNETQSEHRNSSASNSSSNSSHASENSFSHKSVRMEEEADEAKLEKLEKALE